MNSEVYEPAEDSFLLSQAIPENKIKGKNCLDVGTGSGYQAIELAKRGADKILAIDINPKAIEAAKKNALKENIKNIEFIESNLFSKVKDRFDLIIFNAPYLPGEGEMNLALDGGEKGNEIILRFLDKLDKHLEALGECYLLFSSLSDSEEIYGRIKKLKLDCNQIGHENLFFERLIVIKITK